MAEYIKRDDALDAWYDKERYADIEAIPLADVVERKKGKWIEDDDGCLCCSLCGNPCEINCITGEFFETPFCSDCGAEMESE